MGKLKIGDWVAAEKERLTRFQSDYEAKAKSGFPSDWPLEMDPGEWDEQFRLWIDIES